MWSDQAQSQMNLLELTMNYVTIIEESIDEMGGGNDEVNKIVKHRDERESNIEELTDLTGPWMKGWSALYML